MGKHAEQLDREAALARVLAVVNDKGGVGKTSIAANLAGQLAAAGFRCLLVDLNRQANLADDLGVRQSPSNDQGLGLIGSLMQGTTLTPIHEVRPNLDLVCGGTQLEHLTPMMVTWTSSRGRDAYRVLGDALAEVATQYDITVIDCPPESTILTDLALAAARWVLMPTKSDAAGLVGMSLVGERFRVAREINPQLGLLGAVLFATGTRSTSIHAEVHEAVGQAFGGSSPLFTTTVRHAERTAQDARRLGKLVHELEVELANQPAWWEALRSGLQAERRVSNTAASVAEDYRNLAMEVLSVLRAAEEAAETHEAQAVAP